jgi:predicted RNase H-like HicB family nuclease
MIKEYVKAALEKAAYKKLEDDTWFAEIQEFDGVWANAETVEACRNELTEVLEEWIVLKISDHDPLPVVNGLEMKIPEKAVA